MNRHCRRLHRLRDKMDIWSSGWGILTAEIKRVKSDLNALIMMHHPAPHTPATVRVHDDLSYQEFGCTDSFFQLYIRNKDLPVLASYGEAYYKVLPKPGSNPKEDFVLVHKSEINPVYNTFKKECYEYR